MSYLLTKLLRWNLKWTQLSIDDVLVLQVLHFVGTTTTVALAVVESAYSAVGGEV